jgi:hypothetical protein
MQKKTGAKWALTTFIAESESSFLVFDFSSEDFRKKPNKNLSTVLLRKRSFRVTYPRPLMVQSNFDPNVQGEVASNSTKRQFGMKWVCWDCALREECNIGKVGCRPITVLTREHSTNLSFSRVCRGPWAVFFEEKRKTQTAKYDDCNHR